VYVCPCFSINVCLHLVCVVLSTSLVQVEKLHKAINEKPLHEQATLLIKRAGNQTDVHAQQQEIIKKAVSALSMYVCM